MLILTQRPDDRDDQVIITLPDGSTIEICVLAVKGNQVRIGYKADHEICIDRRAIHNRKRRETNGDVAHQ